MKKAVLSILFIAFALSMNANVDGRPITFNELPKNAQTLLSQHFNVEHIMLITIDKEVFKTEYEVKFNDGTEVDFDRKGDLKKVDCKHQQVPDALVPPTVLEYVRTHYAQSFITEWGKDDLRWKAELNNGLDLIFNTKYQFVGFDD